MTLPQFPNSSTRAFTSLRLVDPVRVGSEEEFAVRWQTAQHPLDGSWSRASSSKLMVPAGYAWIELKAGIAFEPNPEGMRQIYSRRNGSNERSQGYRAGYMSHTHPPGPGGGALSFTAHSAIMPVEPGDYFELMVFQNSGTSLCIADVFLEAQLW